VLLTGGHRVGQVFKASQDSLAGFWVFTRHSEDSTPVSFVFHLTTDTSVPMEFLSPGLQVLRYALIAILLAALLWKALPQVKQNRAFWAYFVLLLLIFGILNRIIRTADGSGYEVPIMFQLVVIFHYVSWYVFSFDKLRSLPSFSSTLAGARGLYDRLLGTLRRTSSFAFLVVTLNILFAGLCLWFYKWDGPPLLRYAFGYNYFLYMLVFHVTFSFGPKDSNRSQTAVAKPIPG
jgi:hypothetical protein